MTKLRVVLYGLNFPKLLLIIVNFSFAVYRKKKMQDRREKRIRQINQIFDEEEDILLISIYLSHTVGRNPSVFRHRCKSLYFSRYYLP